MLDLQTYIILLLIVSAISMWFIFRVLYKQIKLFRIRETKEVQSFRVKLFALSLVIVIMGLIPIGINIMSLSNDGAGRPRTVPTLSLIYSAGVHLQLLFLSYILWRIYRLSDEQEESVNELTEKHLRLQDEKHNK